MRTAKRDQRGTSAGPARRGTTRRRVVLGKVRQDTAATERYAVEVQLRNLLNQKGIPASARVHAARTLAEIEGLIGRHQVAPERNEVSPLAGLSRDQLIDELDRLRTAIDLGIVR